MCDAHLLTAGYAHVSRHILIEIAYLCGYPHELNISKEA